MFIIHSKEQREQQKKTLPVAERGIIYMRRKAGPEAGESSHPTAPTKSSKWSIKLSGLWHISILPCFRCSVLLTSSCQKKSCNKYLTQFVSVPKYWWITIQNERAAFNPQLAGSIAFRVLSLMKQGAPRRGSQHWPKVQMSPRAVNLPFALCKARPAEMAGVTPRKKCTCFLFLFVFQGLPSQKQGRSSQKSWGKQQCASRDFVLAMAHTRSKSVLQRRTSQSFPCWSEYSKITGKLALSESCRA